MREPDGGGAAAVARRDGVPRARGPGGGEARRRRAGDHAEAEAEQGPATGAAREPVPLPPIDPARVVLLRDAAALAPGWRGSASAGRWRWRWRPTAATRCGRSRSGSGSPSGRARRPTCRSGMSPARAGCSTSRRRGRCRWARRWRLLGPVLEDPAVLKIGQNVKARGEALRAARHPAGADRRHDADVLRAARGAARARARLSGGRLPRAHAGAGEGADRRRQGGARLRPGAGRGGGALRRRACRGDLAALVGAEAAAAVRAGHAGLRDDGAAAGAGAGRDGAARGQGRPAGAVAAVGRLRAADGGARGGDPRAGRRAVQRREPEAARRGAVRPDGARRRQEGQDRRLYDRRRRAGGAGGAGPRPAGAGARLADAVEAEVDLHRHAAGRDQPGDRAGAHLLHDRGRGDRAAGLDRSEPAEHPGPDRGGPAHPRGLRGRAGQRAAEPRLQPDRAAHPRAYRRHRRR